MRAILPRVGWLEKRKPEEAEEEGETGGSDIFRAPTAAARRTGGGEFDERHVRLEQTAQTISTNFIELKQAHKQQPHGLFCSVTCAASAAP